MVLMLVALIAVVVVVAGAVVAKLTWRPSNDEVHSVKDYHSALGTIGDLASRNPPPASRAGDLSPVREGVHADPGTPLVFDDDQLTRQAAKEATTEAAPVFRSDRARRQALSSMNHRPRRWVLTMAIVVVLAAFGALAYVGSHRNSNHPSKKSASSVTRATSAPAHTTATIPRHTTGTTKPKSKPKRTTPTTVPPIVASATTATTATYPAPSSSYPVVVTAVTGPCWILAQSTDSGTTLSTGTIQAGQSQTFQASGGVGLELGATGATVTLNAVPVVLPSPLNVPFEATFTPGASSTTTTSP
jgi:hypothetical protein